MHRITILQIGDLHYPAIDGLLDRQIAKVTEAYRLSELDLHEVSSFSLKEHLLAIEKHVQGADHRSSIALFVCGPKVQAIASAVFGCVDKRIVLKARVPRTYPIRNVAPFDNYHMYKLVDLTSPFSCKPNSFEL